MVEILAILVPFLPLLGFLINGFLGTRLSTRMVGIIGCASIGLSFVFSLIIKILFEGHAKEVPLYTWVASGDFSAKLSFLIDPLSLTMMLVVSGVGFLIHVYSVGYMHGDEGYARYFAYLNLFTFAMLVLVMADNLLLMFVGWEGVGLCSYLLIGFWYKEDFPPYAGMKAFVVNRIGDFGFLLGIFLIFTAFGTISFTALSPAIQSAVGTNIVLWGKTFGASGIFTAAALLLFLGAVGKSAQIPLYVWLPDAMAGPTPVSALIHAATMVTAGVYMVARMNILYIETPCAMAVVAAVGAVTAFFAATMALTQNDIKKVLAYSTISQIGFMFLACGVGAFSAGVFHLATHAFFKALLFLGAGSVIHALSGEQNIFKMGGLKKHLPATHWTFLAGALAISGIPPLSGFFSKDAILAHTYDGGAKFLWFLAAVTAGLTAFYIFRLYFLVFRGKERSDKHAHESPRVMTVPLILLALLSIAGGWMGIPHILGGADRFAHWLKSWSAHITLSHSTEWVLMGISVLMGAGGVLIAYYLYVASPSVVERLADRARPAYTLLFNKYYVDELYDAVIVSPLVWFSQKLKSAMDEKVIDGSANGIGVVSEWAGYTLAMIQSGAVRHYLMWILIGALFFMFYLFYGQ